MTTSNEQASLTYSELRSKLRALGFTEDRVEIGAGHKKNACRLIHSRSGTVLLFPIRDDSAKVTESDLASTTMHLKLNRVIAPEDWATLLSSDGRGAA